MKLPNQNTPLIHGSRGVISGWGYQKESDLLSVANELQSTALTILQDPVCVKAYKDWFQEGMFCAGVKNGGKDACKALHNF